MDRLVRLLARRSLAPGSRYALATAAILLTAFVRALLPVLGLPFLLFIPMLMAIGFILGRGPGFLATILAAILAAYLFVEPGFSFAIRPRGWIAVGLFAVVDLGIVAACAAFGTVLLQREGELAAVQESRAALSASEAFLQGVLSASADCIKVLNLDANLLFMTEAGKRLMEVGDFNAVQGCPWPDFWRDEENVAARAAVATAQSGGVGKFRGKADTFAGNSRWWDVVVTPILDADGRPERLLSVSRDITDIMQATTDLRESEARTRLLSDELQHRIKNTLALVQAMVRQTLRSTPDIKVAQDTVDQRLAAMARAHGMLTAGGWSSSGLRDVIDAALDLHGDAMGRFEVEGPSAYLGAQAATSFALLLHELGTNAVKYGALSVPSGTVTITWSLATIPGRSGSRKLELVWRERGGPPVTEPSKRGFGSRLIEKSLASSLQGTGVIEFGNDGVVCTVTGIVDAVAVVSELSSTS